MYRVSENAPGPQMISKIKLARLQDLPAINALSLGLGYEALSEQAARHNLIDLLESRSDRIWVAVADDHIVAWIHVFIARRIASALFCEIGGIVVDPEFRNQGIGRQLVNAAEQWASTQNMPLRVRCHVDRREACEFYEALGLARIKVQNVYQTKA